MRGRVWLERTLNPESADVGSSTDSGFSGPQFPYRLNGRVGLDDLQDIFYLGPAKLLETPRTNKAGPSSGAPRAPEWNLWRPRDKVRGKWCCPETSSGLPWEKKKNHFQSASGCQWDEEGSRTEKQNITRCWPRRLPFLKQPCQGEWHAPGLTVPILRHMSTMTVLRQARKPPPHPHQRLYHRIHHQRKILAKTLSPWQAAFICSLILLMPIATTNKIYKNNLKNLF